MKALLLIEIQIETEVNVFSKQRKIFTLLVSGIYIGLDQICNPILSHSLVPWSAGSLKEQKREVRSS